MNKYILLIAVSFTWIACSKKNINTELKIVNDIFLQAVDTIAYKYNSLRPSPQDSLSQKDFKSVSITLYNTLYDIHKWDKSILLDLNDSLNRNLLFYKNLYQATLTDTTAHSLDENKLTNIGRYKLISTNNSDIQKYMGVAGHVKFSRILFNDYIGMLVVTIKDDIKVGIVKLLYLKKENEKWHVVKESVLEIS